MSDEIHRVLNMLAEGKITTSEAENLLKALGKTDNPEVKEVPSKSESKGKPKYLIIDVEPKNEHSDTVHIKIPLQLLRAGVKLASVIPKGANEKVNEALKDKGINIDLDSIKPENIEELIEALTDFEINVNESEEKVKIYCE